MIPADSGPKSLVRVLGVQVLSETFFLLKSVEWDPPPDFLVFFYYISDTNVIKHIFFF